VVSWLTSKVSALLAFKYPGVDLAAWRKASEGSSSDSHAALSRDEQIKAIQDADRARGDKVTVSHPLPPPPPARSLAPLRRVASIDTICCWSRVCGDHTNP